jgi:hypothetical protein
MTRTRIGLATTVLALTALLAGCGGSDALTAKEFRSQANGLCTKADKDTEALGAGLSDASSEKDIADAIDKLVARNQKLVKDIDALDAPASLTDDVDEMLDDVKAALEKLDDATVAELNSMEDPFTDANAKAKAIGLDACAA